MRTLTTKELNQKIATLSPAAIASLAEMIQFFETNSKEQIVTSSSLPKVFPLSDEIYAAKITDTHSYFFFGSDNDGEYIMVLDVTEARKKPVSPGFFAVNDPRKNSSLNPQFNSSINPRFNSSINPRFNSSINPRFNSSINPRFNSSINPKFNSSINPKFNSSINPKFNSSINPRFNYSINPKFNNAYGGPYLYSRSLKQEGYLVHANDQISIVYSMDIDFIGFSVKNESGIILTFDTNNEWVGFWISSGQEPLLRFDQSGEWIGIVV